MPFSIQEVQWIGRDILNFNWAVSILCTEDNLKIDFNLPFCKAWKLCLLSTVVYMQLLCNLVGCPDSTPTRHPLSCGSVQNAILIVMPLILSLNSYFDENKSFTSNLIINTLFQDCLGESSIWIVAKLNVRSLSYFVFLLAFSNNYHERGGSLLGESQKYIHRSAYFNP